MTSSRARKRDSAADKLRKPPPPKVSIDEAIEHMPDAHLHCRDYGHVWRKHSAAYVPAQRLYEQALRCGSCKAIRRRLIGERGNLISNRYEYPRGYVIPGVGRYDVDMRASVRLASVLSTIAPRKAS